MANTTGQDHHVIRKVCNRSLAQWNISLIFHMRKRSITFPINGQQLFRPIQVLSIFSNYVLCKKNVLLSKTEKKSYRTTYIWTSMSNVIAF